MTAAITASSLSELAWVDSAGEPQVRGVITLVRGDAPVLAFTYADAPVARAVAATSSVQLSLTERRSTGAGFQPLLIRGRPRLTEDPSGDTFADELLLQELHRYPPARLYADSPLLQREYWWYLPRLLVEVDVDSVRPIVPSPEPGNHLLVVVAGDDLVVRTARIADSSSASLTLDVHGEAPPAGTAVLFGQDASFPDLEQWSQWRYRGWWDSATFQVQESPARTGLGPAPGLLRRWNRHRDFERRCRKALT